MSLFPENGLSSSYVVTVWLGALVVAFFNRRFGWPLSGLVIPGILSPLLLVKPAAAAVLGAEGVLTYLLVRGTCWMLTRLSIGSELFGRDRFFAMLLWSAPARVLLEGWALPALHVPWADDGTGIGLVAVPLVANRFWKTGLLRGLGIDAVSLVVVSVALRWVLVPLGGFDLNGLSLLTDSINTRIESTPRAYIVLLTTAFLGSQLNRRYGWDLGGILFPALLALQLFDPWQLFSTLLEALSLYWISAFILRLPYFRSRGLEGASRLMLFFSLAFSLRLVAGHLSQRYFPELPGDDFMGFGFLISTLLAMRAAEPGAGPRVFAALGSVAVAGAGLALLCSTLLERTHGPALPASVASRGLSSEIHGKCSALVERDDFGSLLQVFPAASVSALFRALTRVRPEFFAPMYSESVEPFDPAELRAFRSEVLTPLIEIAIRSWSLPAAAPLSTWRPSLEPLAERALHFGYRLAALGAQDSSGSPLRLALLEPGGCHRGMVLLALGPSLPVAIAVTRPLQEPMTLEAGLWLFDQLPARVFVSPTAHPLANADWSSDPHRYANRENLCVATVEALTRSSASLAFVDVKSWRNVASGTRVPDAVVVIGKPDPADVVGRGTSALVARLQKRFQAVGLELAVKDGSPRTAGAPEPSFLLASNAARGASTSALALAVHPDSVKALTPVSGPSQWEEHWAMLGLTPKVVALRQPAVESGHLPSDVRQEIQGLLQDGNWTRLDRLRAQRPHLRIGFVEDSRSARQFLSVRSEDGVIDGLVPVHGHWLARKLATASQGPARKGGSGR